MHKNPEKQPLIIKPLAMLVLKSPWYWAIALLWVTASIYGAGFGLKGIAVATVMAIAWFIAIYATFGTAIAKEIENRETK